MMTVLYIAKNTFQSIAVLATTMLAIIIGVSNAATLDISDVPLELTPAVPPNVLIVTDDSFSMDWEVLTQDNLNDGAFNSSHLNGTIDAANPITERVVDGDGAADGDAANPSCVDIVNPAIPVPGEYENGYLYIVAFPNDQFTPTDLARRNCYVADDDAWRARSHTFNKLYFNPAKKYEPWAGVDINGNEYTNADITSAPDDPYNPQDTIDLTSEKAGLTAAGARINDGIGFKYFIWTDANSDGIAQASEQPTTIDTDVFLIKDQDAATQINFANWFTYYRKREFVAKAIISHSVANNSSARVGHGTINQNIVASNVQVAPLNQSIFSGNKKMVLDAIGLTNSSGETPLRTAYEKAGEYFRCSGNGIFSNSSSNPGDADCPFSAAPGGSCQVNSTFLLTDGFANGGNPVIVTSDEDSTSGANNSDFDDGAFADGVSNTLADIAMFYYETDLQNLVDDVPVTSVDLNRDPETGTPLQADGRLHQHLNTNVIGIFNQPDSFDNTFPSDATTAVGVTWLDRTTFPGRFDDLKHAAYNGRGSFIPAISGKNFPDVISDVNNAFSTATTTPGSTTSLAFNTQSITQDTLVFRTFSNLATNSGDLVAQRVNADGTFRTDPVTGDPDFEWNATRELPAPATRLILTYADESSPSLHQGRVFSTTAANGLTTAQEARLIPPAPANLSPPDPIAETRVNYLRGDTTNEGTSFDDGNMRMRAAIGLNSDGITTGGKIGDIVHSSPVFVGQPPFANRGTGAYPTTAGNTYFEFRNQITPVNIRDRDELVYVGANDGMLHAFQVEDGVEKFAYVPNVLLDKLPKYTDPNYGHQFFVDSTPSVDDAYIDPRPIGGNREWRTVLVNGLGAGGQGYFALDVTDPDAIGTGSVMWEFTDDDDIDLGFTYSRPIIAMSNVVASSEQRWVAVFGNGFNNTAADGQQSTTGNAAIYILFLEEGYDGWSSSDYIKIDTGNGTANGMPNGISGVRGIDTDGNGTADRLYAGDLQGNVYVVDISNPDPTTWQSSLSTLFQASYATSPTTSTAQPITSRPTVIKHPTSTGYIVLVGTGSYFTKSDASSTDIQSIYGLWDNLQSTNPNTNTSQIIKDGLASQLVEQTLTTSINTVSINSVDTDVEVRTITANPVNYNDNTSDAIADVRGWFIDFDVSPPSGTGIQFPGERPVRELQLRNNQLFFSTVIPQDGTSCDPPAGGFGLGVNPVTGGAGMDVIFDINIDNIFDQADNLNGVVGELNIVVGTRFQSSPSDSTFIGNYRVTQLSNTNLDRIFVNPDLNSGGGLGSLLGRHSWKEIRM